MRFPHLALLGRGWPAYVAKQTADHLPVFCLDSPSTRHRSIRRRGRHTPQRRHDQISSAGDRCESEGQDGRLGGCEAIQRDRSCLPIVCIAGAAVRAPAVVRCAQRRSFRKAVRASAGCHCGFSTSRYQRADLPSNQLRLGGSFRTKAEMSPR
jgi:hypothetical protein